jgi:hypothetical protein
LAVAVVVESRKLVDKPGKFMKANWKLAVVVLKMGDLAALLMRLEELAEAVTVVIGSRKLADKLEERMEAMEESPVSVGMVSGAGRNNGKLAVMVMRSGVL